MSHKIVPSGSGSCLWRVGRRCASGAIDTGGQQRSQDSNVDMTRPCLLHWRGMADELFGLVSCHDRHVLNIDPDESRVWSWQTVSPSQVDAPARGHHQAAKVLMAGAVVR